MIKDSAFFEVFPSTVAVRSLWFSALLSTRKSMSNPVMLSSERTIRIETNSFSKSVHWASLESRIRTEQLGIWNLARVETGVLQKTQEFSGTGKLFN